MNEFLDIKSKLNFEKFDLTAPDKVLMRIGEKLVNATDGYVYGEIAEYSGPITSYYKPSTFTAIAAALGTGATKVDVQDKLGKIGDEIKKFEFYLFTPAYRSYKYRILFVEFGIGNYPVKVVLEDGVAEKILPNGDFVVQCSSSNEFEEFVMQILNTPHIISVMQELINITNIKRQERNDEDSSKSEEE